METTLQKQLEVQENHKGLMIFSEKLKASLTEGERQVIELKYASPRFRELTTPQVEVMGRALLLKIHAITGWVIPEGKEHRDVLVDQFRKKLWESYANCNAEEVEYAFRNYGTLVKDWGKQMNLSMIDEVMVPYLARRAELSKMEEEKSKPELPAPSLTDQSMIDWMEETRKQLKEKKTSVAILPVMLYEYIVKQGLINPDAKEKKAKLQDAVAYRQAQLCLDCENNSCAETERKLSQFMKMKETGVFEGEEVENLKRLAKRLILFEYLME